MAEHEHRWRMIKAKDGSYHRVCMDCKQKQSARVVKKTSKKSKPARAKPTVKFVKQYTSTQGRIFRQYERTDTGQRVDIIMRNDRGYNTLMNYSQAEATAEAKRRLGVK